MLKGVFLGLMGVFVVLKAMLMLKAVLVLKSVFVLKGVLVPCGVLVVYSLLVLKATGSCSRCGGDEHDKPSWKPEV